MSNTKSFKRGPITNSAKNRKNRYSGRNSKYSSSKSNSRSRWRSSKRRNYKKRIPHTKYVSASQNTQDETDDYIVQNSFRDFSLVPQLLKNIYERKYQTPTKIQDQAIPHIMQGRDILGIASTGSGKTGAFLIPLINKCLLNKNERVLIVTPTRELANQIHKEFKLFTNQTKLRMTIVIGGANIRTQISLLRTKPNFVVATPGRLIDLEKRGVIKLDTFNNIVLDEVDQMLDMGFVEDISLIISKLGENRQSLFFSATMKEKEENIANTLLRNPIKIESYNQSPLKNIHQDIVKVPSNKHKQDKLHELLSNTEYNKVIVFSGTKIGADSISKKLVKFGIKADSLHGGKSQSKRTKTLSKFRQDKIDVLVATDVASRGIDVPNISHVINFDEPANYSDYIHRIGRTGRIGKKGTALTFVVVK